MTNLETTFTDISGWHKNVHYSTGGTRSKYIALHPNTNEEYFFKGSQENLLGEIKYSNEFWSEIVSSKIGQFFGFPMLDYNIAFNKYHKQKIGCISKSMVFSSRNKLTEGVTYLTGTNSNYIPSLHKTDYTFQFISEALQKFNFEKYIENIIEIIVFDSMIGNSDRHQENWSILTAHKISIEEKSIDEEDSRVKKRSLYRKVRRLANRFFSDESKELTRILENPNYTVKFKTSYKFAPIYDSGCCLGREHTDEKVLKMLNDSQMIEKYVSKGESEIHWEGFQNKRKHFELIELLINKHPMLINPFLEMVKIKYNPDEIKIIINNIDAHLPSNLDAFKLSNNRKELMFKLVTLRIEKLIKYL